MIKVKIIETVMADRDVNTALENIFNNAKLNNMLLDIKDIKLTHINGYHINNKPLLVAMIIYEEKQM